MILKNTTAFRLNQIGYSTLDDDRLVIWSLSNLGAFNATELIQLFTHPFSSYIQYNREMERCELVIF